jgi:hypothetical protein
MRSTIAFIFNFFFLSYLQIYKFSLSYMKLRSCKSLIRLLLFLISTQCISPCVNAETVHSSSAVLHAGHGQTTLSIIFEENKSAAANEDTQFLRSYVILDFSLLVLQNSVYTPHLYTTPHNQAYDLQPALFKLNHTYLI